MKYLFEMFLMSYLPLLCYFLYLLCNLFHIQADIQLKSNDILYTGKISPLSHFFPFPSSVPRANKKLGEYNYL